MHSTRPLANPAPAHRTPCAGSSAPLRLLALVALALLLAAGCGGEDGSGNSGSDGSSASGSSGAGDGAGADDSADGGGGDRKSVAVPCANRKPSATGSDADVDEQVAKRDGSYDAPPRAKLDPAKHYVAKVSTTVGDFEFDLLPDEGPIAAENFAALACDGFYDGVRVHRIVPDFVIQTGDPRGDGSGGPGYELTDDEVQLPYKRGIVAMANAGPDTGGSQFFVVLSDSAQFAPSYAIFGRVVKGGMKDVDKVVQSGQDPAKPVRVKQVVIDVR